MTEVSSRVCIPIVDQMLAKGVPIARINALLSVPVDRLRGAPRASWDDFLALLEAVRGELGEVAELPPALLAQAPGVVLLRALAAHSRDARELYRLGNDWYLPSIFSNLQLRLVELPDGRLRETVDLLPLFRPSPVFFEILGSAFANAPLLLGHPRADVEVDVSDRRAVYTIRATARGGPVARWLGFARPRPRDLLAGAADELTHRQEEYQELGRALASAREQVDERRGESAILDALGRHVGHQLELEPLADAIVSLLHEHLRMGGVALSLVRPPLRELEEVCRAGETEGEPMLHQPLTVSDRVIGGIDVWSSDGPGTARPLQTRRALEKLTPWLSLALDDAGASKAILAQSRRLDAETADRKRAEQHLLQAQKMDAVGRLGRGMAHDFNNLLTIIHGYATMALKRIGAPEEVSESLREIKIASERGSRLVAQLQAFSRRRVLQPARGDLNQLVRDLEPMLQQILGEKVRLDLELEPDLPAVRIDRAQIEQVLVNLVQNASDASSLGGRVTIGTRRAEAVDLNPSHEGGDVQVFVRDTGRGMDRETRAHAFDPFFTTRPAREGSGLGLTTVHSIVTQSGGAIWIDSELGAGTTVTIELPRDMESEVCPAAERASAAARDCGGKEGIVLVEDDPQLRRFASEVLSQAGYTVLAAGSGAEAAAQVDEYTGELELLVTDVILPDMDGRELAGKLLEARPGLRQVVYVSGYEHIDLGVYTPLPREASFLRKPFGPDGLLQAVRQALDGAPD